MRNKEDLIGSKNSEFVEFQEIFEFQEHKLSLKDFKSKTFPIFRIFLFITFSIGFFLIQIQIMGLHISFNFSFYILSILNWTLFYKLVQLLLFWKEIYNDRKINLKILMLHICPIMILSLSISFFFSFNSQLHLIELLNYLSEEPSTLIFPILLIIVLVISLGKTLKKSMTKYLDLTSNKLKNWISRNSERIKIMITLGTVFKHVKYSLSIELLLSFLYLIYKIEKIIFIILSIFVVTIFNFLYFLSKKKRFEEDYILEKKTAVFKFKVISIPNLIIFGLFIAGLIFYIFNIMNFQDIGNQLLKGLISNPFFLILFLIVVVFYSLKPLYLILNYVFVKVAKLFYRFFLLKYLYSILFSLVLIIFLKALLYKANWFNLDEILQWIISILLSVFVSLFKKKIKSLRWGIFRFT